MSDLTDSDLAEITVRNDAPGAGRLWTYSMISRLVSALREARRERDEAVANQEIAWRENRAKIQRQRGAIYRTHLSLVEHKRVRFLERARAEAAEAEAAKLRAEIERLREALRPFAEAGRHFDPGYTDDGNCYVGMGCGAITLQVGDFRRAAAALRPAPAETPKDVATEVELLEKKLGVAGGIGRLSAPTPVEIDTMDDRGSGVLSRDTPAEVTCPDCGGSGRIPWKYPSPDDGPAGFDPCPRCSKGGAK